MIVEVVTYAIAGLGFIRAAGRLFVRDNFSAGMNTVMTQNGVTRPAQCQEGDISVLTEAS